MAGSDQRLAVCRGSSVDDDAPSSGRRKLVLSRSSLPKGKLGLTSFLQRVSGLQLEVGFANQLALYQSGDFPGCHRWHAASEALSRLRTDGASP